MYYIFAVYGTKAMRYDGSSVVIFVIKKKYIVFLQYMERRLCAMMGLLWSSLL